MPAAQDAVVTRHRIRAAIGLCCLGAGIAAGCAETASDRPRLTQAQELCQSWGYDPHDPVCLRTFRRDSP